MKLFPISLLVLLGAALASWGAYRIFGFERRPSPRVFLPAVLPPPVASITPSGPSAADLERLSLENRELAAELAEARARLAQADEALTSTRENLEELRRPMENDVMSSTLRAELKSGEVVVTGGYRLPDGTRAYAFVQPVVVRENGQDMLNVTGMLRAVDDATGETVGLDNLATNADNTLQHGEVWVEDEQRVIFEALDHVSAPAGVSLPSVSVAMGKSARITVGGLSIRVWSELGADRETLDFEVRLEQVKPAEASGEEGGAASTPSE